MTRNLKSVKESLSRVAMFQSLGESDLEAMSGVASRIMTGLAKGGYIRTEVWRWVIARKLPAV